MAEARALNCPQCGAGAPAKSTACPFCGVKLATISCPKCFGMVFLGSHHCQHCGAAVQEPRKREGAPWKCPRGCGDLRAMTLGGVNYDECPACSGMWLEATAFERLTAERERQTPFVLPGAFTRLPKVDVASRVQYVPCPECRTIMNRMNFAKASGVIIDICRDHGVWFDADELRRIIQFIQAGGIDVARAKERLYLEEERRLAMVRQSLGRIETGQPTARSDREFGEPAAGGLAAVIISYLRG